MNLTLYKTHLQYDSILQRMYSDFLFAESINQKTIIVHTLSGNYRVTVAKIRRFAWNVN